jgi:D-arginine dehydrogenase
MEQMHFDVVIIGAGIAGSSIAACLAPERRVALLERESQPGYHSTGRSAALFSETYGNFVVRALSRASRDFLFDPPQGFSEYPLVSARGALHIAREDQKAELEKFLSTPDIAAHAEVMTADRVRELCPILRGDYAIGGVLESQARDVDVHGLHQGYLSRIRAAGGRLFTDAEITGLERTTRGWSVHTRLGMFEAPVVVNAAGAWADEIAKLAGLAPIGIVPHRRTAVIVDAPEGTDIANMPLTIDIGESFYFKPEAGKILLSPADETPSPPCDAQPEDMDVAIAIDRVQSATTLEISRVPRKWAGLRSFAPDRSLVIGFDPAGEGFFWLAGQGGYGIQTAPAASRTAAALVCGHPMPEDVAAGGVTAHMISPQRFLRG